MFRQAQEPVRCPVCDDWIGTRWIQEGCSAYCKECRFTFYYKAHENVPHKNTKGRMNEKQGCGCGSCGR